MQKKLWKSDIRAFQYDAMLKGISMLLPKVFLERQAIDKKTAAFRLYVSLLRAYAWTIEKVHSDDPRVIDALQKRRSKKIMRAALKIRWWDTFVRSKGLSIRGQTITEWPVSTRSLFMDTAREELRAQPGNDTRIVWRLSGGSTTGIPVVWAVDKRALNVHCVGNYVALLRRWHVHIDGSFEKNFYVTFNYAHPDLPMADFRWFGSGNIRVQVLNGVYEPEFEKKIDALCMLLDSLEGRSIVRINPIALRFLIQELRVRNLHPAVGAFIAVGNPIEEAVREEAVDYFQCPVVGQYGAQEFGTAALECPVIPGNYHILPERVLVEILDDSGNPKPSGEMGHITVTCLDSFEMPLMRYQPGDIGTLSPANCTCGNNTPVLTITRRVNEVIRYADGSEKSARYIFRYFSRPPFVHMVRRFQIAQERIDTIRISLEVREPLPEKEMLEFERNIRGVYGETLSYRIEQVPAIEDSGRKFRVFIPLSETTTDS